LRAGDVRIDPRQRTARSRGSAGLAFSARSIYLTGMLRKYPPCIPTRATEVPAGPDWFHEIKHDGYRLMVQREGKRVRLFTRRGYDWSDRYPLITQAALRLRKTSFVIDGEAVVLRPDGISDFDALHGVLACFRPQWPTLNLTLA
jgi:ATP-dependent DNA ligase